MSSLPVGSELAGDAQNVHHSLQLQLSAAYRRGDKAARPANPGAASRGAWETGSFLNVFQQQEESPLPLSVPAVDDDRPCPGSRPSVRLHVGHQLQQRHRRVGGFVVGP